MQLESETNTQYKAWENKAYRPVRLLCGWKQSVHDDHLFEATLNDCYTLCFQPILPIALNATYADEWNSSVCFPLVVQLVHDRTCCSCHPQHYLLASNEKYSYIGVRVSIHRSRSLLQLSDTTVKTSDGVVLAVIHYSRLLLVTSFSIGVCWLLLIRAVPNSRFYYSAE